MALQFKMMKKRNKKNGFALLVAIITTGMLLLVSFVIINIALKQLILTYSDQESQTAFYAAESGIECAVYWDVKHPGDPVYSPFATSSASISCNNVAGNSDSIIYTGVEYPSGNIDQIGGSGVEGTYTNLAPSSISMSTNHLDGYPDANAFDSDLTTYWENSLPGVTTDWVGVGFGTISAPLAKNISEIDVLPAGNCGNSTCITKSYHVQYSKNYQSSWKDVPGGAITNNTSASEQSIVFDTIPDVTNVRVLVTAPAPDGHDYVADLQVWGYNAAAVTSTFGVNFYPLSSCAIVQVIKNPGGSTTINARGYNTCDSNALRRFERGVSISY